MRPLIKVINAEQDGKEHQGNQRNRARGGLAGAAGDDAPPAAGDVLQHQTGARPAGEDPHQPSSRQGGAVELERRNQESSSARERDKDADSERARAPILEIGAKFGGNQEVQGLGGHCAPPSLPRSSRSEEHTSEL